MNTAYIGVGTNINRQKHAQVAWDELSLIGYELRCSPIYECAPVGFKSHRFYNFVIELKTSVPLDVFVTQLRAIETKWGRAKDATKFQDRNLDLDIILFGDEVCVRSPQLPRDDIYKYPFVIQPLYDLCPERVIPNDGRCVAALWQQMDNLDSLSEVALNLNHN